jgi:phosphosulfolactate synthase
MEKPREKGLSMMMDWGLPVGELEDRLGMIAPYVDFAKFVVGTARLYDEEYLQRKLEIYHAHRVYPFIGGQFL